MKRLILFLIISLAISACADDNAPVDVSDIIARATAQKMIADADAQIKVATQIAARKTALAPTNTPRPTNTPVPTNTPTLTPTLTPTNTPDAPATERAIGAVIATTTATYNQARIESEQAQLKVEAAMNDRRNNQVQSILWIFFWLLVIAALVVGLLLLAFHFWRTMEAARDFNQARTLNELIRSLPDGSTLMWYKKDGVVTPYLQRPQQLAAPAVQDEMIDMLPVNTTHGTIAIIKHDPTMDNRRNLAKRLLRAAIEQNGATSNQIPGWRKLNWDSETWQRAIETMREHIVAEPFVGTRIVNEQYPTLYALYAALHEHKIHPAPLSGSGDSLRTHASTAQAQA